MEIRQLRYFIAVADHLHFGKAAEALDITPSALSMQLQALEKELKVQLVQRTKRSVALTVAGRLFLEEARASLLQLNRAALIAERAGRGEVGKLEIGYVTSAVCAGVVQQLLQTCRAQFPEVSIALHGLESPSQIELLNEGKLDACIIRTEVGNPELHDRIRLLTEPVVIALPTEHALARFPAIRAQDLAGETFITPQFQRDFGFSRHLASIGQKAGFVPILGMPTKDFITSLGLVASGFGIAAVPQSVRCLQIPGIEYRPFSDLVETSELTMILRRNDRAPAVAALRQLGQAMAAQPD